MKHINIGTAVACALLCLGFAGRSQAQGNWVNSDAFIRDKVAPNGSSIIASGTKGTVSLFISAAGNVTASATFTVSVMWSTGSPPPNPPVYSINIPCSYSGSATGGTASSGVSADNSAYRMNDSGASYNDTFTPSSPFTSYTPGTYSFYPRAQVNSTGGGTATATATLTRS